MPWSRTVARTRKSGSSTRVPLISQRCPKSSSCLPTWMRLRSTRSSWISWISNTGPASPMRSQQMPRQRGHQGLAGPRRTPDQPSPALSANALCQARGIGQDSLHSVGIVVRCHQRCGKLWEYRDKANLLAGEFCFTLSKLTLTRSGGRRQRGGRQVLNGAVLACLARTGPLQSIRN